MCSFNDHMLDPLTFGKLCVASCGGCEIASFLLSTICPCLGPVRHFLLMRAHGAVELFEPVPMSALCKPRANSMRGGDLNVEKRCL